MNPSLSILSFTDYAFCTVSKNSLPHPRSSRFSPVLSFRSLIAFHCTFKSMINFELIFLKDAMSGSRFIVLHVDIQLFWHHVLKQLSCIHCVIFVALSNISWLYLCGYISGLTILFHWSIVYSFTSTTLSWLL